MKKKSTKKKNKKVPSSKIFDGPDYVNIDVEINDKTLKWLKKRYDNYSFEDYVSDIANVALRSMLKEDYKKKVDKEMNKVIKALEVSRFERVNREA